MVVVSYTPIALHIGSHRTRLFLLYPVAAAKRPRLTAEAAGVLAGVSSGGVTEAILAQRLTDHVERIDSDMASCLIWAGSCATVLLPKLRVRPAGRSVVLAGCRG